MQGALAWQRAAKHSFEDKCVTKFNLVTSTLKLELPEACVTKLELGNEGEEAKGRFLGITQRRKGAKKRLAWNGKDVSRQSMGSFAHWLVSRLILA